MFLHIGTLYLPTCSKPVSKISLDSKPIPRNETHYICVGFANHRQYKEIYNVDLEIFIEFVIRIWMDMRNKSHFQYDEAFSSLSVTKPKSQMTKNVLKKKMCISSKETCQYTTIHGAP